VEGDVGDHAPKNIMAPSSFIESNSQRLNKIIQSKERENKHKNNKYTGKNNYEV